MRRFWVFLLPLAACAHAGEAALSFENPPTVLKAHSSVRLIQERVLLTVHADFVDVESEFSFKNDGAAAYVRMGFPLEADESPVFFSSYVDGDAVETTSETIGAGTYRVKMVQFAKGAVRRVRDVYRLPLAPGTDGLFHVGFIMHTAASWKGPIGRAELIVRFDNPRVKPPIKPLAAAPKDPTQANPSQVFCTSFTHPTVSGSELHFVRSNFEPTAKEDLRLTFGYPPSS